MRYSLYDVSSQNSRGAGGLNAPSASAGLDNLDQTIAVSNTLTLSARTVLETRAQFAHSDLKAPPTDPIGPAVSIAGVASFGTLSGSPDAPREQDVSGRQQPVAPGGRARAPRRRRLPLQRRPDHVSRDRFAGSYTFSSLANFLAGIYNNAGFTQTFGVVRGVADESERRRLRAGRVEGRLSRHAESRRALRPAVPRDDQHRHQQRLAARSASPGRRSPRAARVVRGSAGLFYDRVPLRALANALLSAGNTTDLNNLRQISVSLSPTQAGAPVFPNILPRRRARR